MDTVVRQEVVKTVPGYFSFFIKRGNIKTVFHEPSEHCFPTVDYGNACSHLGSPYINKCDYDAAGDLLRTIYNDSAITKGTQDPSHLYAFSQSEYGSGSGIADLGYIYVPQACASGARCQDRKSVV